ncbi:MAG: hypothetical protein K2G22_02240 [Eubacterium sp.]|nr:hypothetical protein [Eubacterium sp.]
MNVKTKILNFVQRDNGFRHISESEYFVDYPSECPYCNKSIFPSQIISVDVSVNNEIASIFVCNACKKYIFTIHRKTSVGYHIVNTFPIPTEIKKFSDSITGLSPKFVKIYEQSSKSESNGFNEICGMGYRKALEFLIKDYAIYRHPENEEDIKNSHLAKCIKDYCDNDKIKNLAQACAWIGNDETHYIRIHEDYSVQELKAFINAAVTLIEAELSFDEATKLLSSK